MDSNKHNSRIPQLRFPGFEGEWEEKTFGELYKKNNIKNDLSFGVDKIISVANMYFKTDANVGDEEYLKSYNVFHLGDIAYEGNKSANYAYGRFVENTIGDGIVSHVFDVYSPVSKDHCLGYWKYAINYERIMRPVLEKSTIKSTMMTNLIAKDFLKQKTLVPSPAEQQKIADCLEAEDRMISAQEQKVEALTEKKKGLMQELFPQSGESTPRLRFPGFTEEWEQKMLGEVFDKNNERNTDRSIGFDKTISIASMTYNPSGNGAAEDSLKTYKVLRIGDIAFEGHKNKDFAYGRFVMNDIGSGIISPRFTSLRPKCPLEVEFWKKLINYEPIMRSILVNSTKMGTMMNELIVSEVLKQTLPVPSIAEQRKIASCLSSLDDTIQTETDKLETLKVHKRGLLQQLFPQP